MSFVKAIAYTCGYICLYPSQMRHTNDNEHSPALAILSMLEFISNLDVVLDLS